MNSWYAVHTQPNSEQKALQHLLRQGFDVYLPKYLKRRSHARKIDWVATPLFPRYLFVGMNIEQMRWRAIQSTVGVSYLVSFGGQPVQVPPSIVEGLRARENDKGLISFAKVAPFQKGEKIRLLGSAFEDSVGRFDHLDDQGRVTLLLELMGQEVRVTAPLEKVSAVG
ncbi:MAG: transcriptional activator RfaH [Rhodospirillales bacterium]|nr:transcriptional activator RfaH [Rhodospirillales bacterium]